MTASTGRLELQSRDQFVAHPIDGQDCGAALLVLFDLLAQLDDEVVDRAVRRISLDAPDLVEISSRDTGCSLRSYKS